jgi:hypothetical protein
MKILASFLIVEKIYPIVSALLPNIEAVGMMFQARYTTDPTGKTGPTHRVSEGNVDEDFVIAFQSAAVLVQVAKEKGLTLPLNVAEAITNGTQVMRDYVGPMLHQQRLFPYIGDIDEEDPTSS